MNYQDEIAFFEKQEGFASAGRETAVSAKNFPLLAMNCRQLFRLRLMIGLISWRHGSNPQDDLKLALSRLTEDADALLVMNPAVSVASQLPMATASIHSYLLGQDRLIVDNASEDPQAQLDELLANALHGSHIGDSASSLIAATSRKPNLRLLASTYQNYFDIIATAPNSEKFSGLVAAAEVAYKTRATSSYYSGGDQTEGGGPDNELVVDYRLAAALKKNGSLVNSIHAWRWD